MEQSDRLTKSLEAVATPVAAASFCFWTTARGSEDAMRGKIWSGGILALAAAVAARGQGDQWNDVVKRATAAEIAGDYAVAAAMYREASRLAEAFAPADARRVYAFNAEGMMYDAMGR